MHFNMKSKNSLIFIPITFEEEVKRFTPNVYPEIRIHYVTKKNNLPVDQ